jgi:hypothetical protein
LHMRLKMYTYRYVCSDYLWPFRAPNMGLVVVSKLIMAAPQDLVGRGTD